MCGIAGIVSTERGGRIETATIRAMCQAIVHRGPDDEGVYVKDGVGLGMRRLSIIDVAGGHQPVFNEDKTVWIVFNGEIYNFPELRPDLERRGHKFYTHTDTEVIVHLYEEYGAQCVEKLRGMFAFGLYDANKQSLLLARDRLGKKPLHYAVANGRLYFGSEIKSILAVAPEFADVNQAALLQYLYFGYILDPISAFQPIQKVPPGHILQFNNGEVRVSCYWDLPEYGTRAPVSEHECLEQLEQLLEESVRLRLISDVPLGALLSGGADSSTVVALMARASSKPVKTFSIGFQSQEFDEAPYARLVAKKFQTEHHELILDPQVVDTLESLTRSLEEPFGDSSMLPTYYVSHLARQHVTVALSGDGGDELFAGYQRYATLIRRTRYEAIPIWLRTAFRERVFPLLPKNMPARRLSYNVSLPWRDRYIDQISFVPGFERQTKLLSDDFRAAAGSDPRKVMFDYFDKAPARDPVSKTLYVDTKAYLPGDILTKVDRMSMLTSLEVRVPILDHVFVEWVTSLPAGWKVRGEKLKHIFRKLAERVGVPREVLYRPKSGFALPIVHWMRNELKDMVLILLEPKSLQRGYFEPSGVRQILDEHFSGRRDQSHRIWRLLMLELWHRNFLDRVGLPDFGDPISSTMSLRAESR
jgi:asparagine synthase (glutamine-hydrolysing)